MLVVIGFERQIVAEQHEPVRADPADAPEQDRPTDGDVLALQLDQA